VRAVSEQFFGAWRTFGARTIQADADALNPFVNHAKRARKGVKIPFDAQRLGFDIGELAARGSFDLERAGAEFLQGEHCQLIGQVGRNIGLFALGEEIAVHELNAG